MSLGLLHGCSGASSTRPSVPVTSPRAAATGSATGLPVPEIHVEGLPPESVEVLRLGVLEAFSFALKQNGWSQPHQVAEAPLEVVVIQLARGTAAAASGPRRFSVSKDSLGAPNIHGVFAHELTHVQDFRVAGSALASIPRYLVEGKALAVGRAFRAHRNDAADDVDRARLLSNLTATEGREALALFRGRAGMQEARERRLVGRFMSVSVFFVEFLRARAGISDPVGRLSRVWEQAGIGVPFEQAFEQVFGRPLVDLESEFVTFLEQTEGNPAERLRGTAYAAVGPR
jgi:hypothetical protein